ncbi:MAG: cell division protein FtsZ [Bacteroidales bacterium]|jgi:cell division protein FtsZ|nr:cell division protein FtsZ [Bacteroidales bacterium]
MAKTLFEDKEEVFDDDIFGLPKKQNIIKVIGVGGGGGNAVNHMFERGIKDVDFIVANTDNQALALSPVPIKIQLGPSLTEGLGAGNNPEHGAAAAVESIEAIANVLGGVENTKMLFVTAGMGGGTGTGAAPVICKHAKEAGILTVAIVTVPFRFEGPRRVNQAIKGLEALKQNVDSLLVIDNDKILEQYASETVTIAFGNADEVLTQAAKGIAEIITVSGHVNVDFADVQTVLKDSGIALMGTGMADGDNRDIQAVKNALNSPLLSNNKISGAKNILINVFSSKECELKLGELNNINSYIQNAAGLKADLIWGQSTDDSLGSRLNVTLIASGFLSSEIINPFDNGGSLNVIQVNADSGEETTEQPAQEDEPTPATPDAPADVHIDEPVGSHAPGEDVELDIEDDDPIPDTPDEDPCDTPEDDAKNISRIFMPIDFGKVDVDEYERTPAYERKGSKLNIGNYTGANYKKITLATE